MTVVVNSDDGELSEIIIDENILSALNMSQNEFNREFNKKYNTTVASSKSLAGWFTSFTLLLQEDNQPAIQDNDESLSDCIIKCHQEFTDENGMKIRGRGACKAGCWFEAASDFVVELIQTVF